MPTGSSKAVCPDWYPSLRAAKYAGVPWTTALGCEWSDTMMLCCQIAESAEAKAQEYLTERASKR